jgi:SSS family solute:Na+ symporter
MIDFAIVAAFVLYSVGVGLKNRRQASLGLDEYFLAGRSISGTRAGLSMAATQFAADTPLLVTGLIAAGGIFSLWRLWIYALAFLLMGFVLASAWRRAGVLTDAELVTRRYDDRGALMLRGLKAVYYGTVINCVVMAFVLIAAVRIFEVFLPWHEWLPPALYEALASAVGSLGLLIDSGQSPLDPRSATTNNVLSIAAMLVFVALYSTTGGLRSVIATDVVQLALMMAGTAVYAWLAVDSAGGLSALPASLASVYGDAGAARFLSFAPRAEDAILPFIVVVSLQWFFQMNSDGTGYLAQRTMACRTDRDARHAAVVFTVTQVVLRSLLWLLIGVALLVVYPFDASSAGTDAFISRREMTFVTGMDELLPAGARGLMLTAMLAALASTLDTHLNWGASYWSNDLYKGVWVEGIRGRDADPGRLVLVARLSAAVILAIALVVMANLGSIQTAWQMSLLFGAGTGAVLVLRWLWERVNLWCEVASIVVSVVIAPILILAVEDDWIRLLVMSGVSFAVVVAAALIGAPTSEARRVEFYRAVRPPGFWRATARECGDDPRVPERRLYSRARQVAAASASVFGWLLGGAWLLLRPDLRGYGLAAIVAATASVVLWRPGADERR